MSTWFSRSLHSLEVDRFRGSTLGLFLVATLLGAWGAWSFLARIALYEVTDTARLEVSRAVHPVQAPVSGRVVATQLVLPREVQVNDVLVELDSAEQRLQLEEERTRPTALAPQLNAVRDEIAAEERALDEARHAARVALDESRARLRETEALATFAEEKAERFDRFYAKGYVAELDFLQAKAEAKRLRALAEAVRLTISRLEWDERMRQSDRQARLERLQSEASRLEGQLATSAATIRRLEHEIDKRRIRAPTAGRLGEVANLRIGAVVHEGDKLGAVVPSGTLKVAAEFLPSAALGRIRPGQPARLRLHGFPWAQYGSISAAVASVASEVRGGRVRVELFVRPNPASPIPFEHGLPGTVEVEVERVSPAMLALRLAGQLLATPRVSSDLRDGQQAQP